MKRTDIAELRKMDIKTLKSKLENLQKEFVLAKLKAKRGELKNVRKAKMIRKDIARIKTIIRELKEIK